MVVTYRHVRQPVRTLVAQVLCRGRPATVAVTVPYSAILADGKRLVPAREKEKQKKDTRFVRVRERGFVSCKSRPLEMATFQNSLF